MLYYDNNQKDKHTKDKHHGRTEPQHEYGLPEDEPYISEDTDEYNNSILSVFADEIFPDDDLGI